MSIEPVCRGAIAVLFTAMCAAALPVAAQAGQSAAPTQTFTGAAAQKSAQADLFVAYEQAFLDGGLDAADKFMSPAKRAEVKEMLQAFGAESLKQMQAEKRKARVPSAELRKRILRVEVTGDYAYLEARSDRPQVLDVAAFEKTADGWKVTPVRR